MSDFLDTRKGESPASGATEDGAFGAKREGSDTQAEFSAAQAAPAIIDTAAAVSFLQWLRPEGPWLLSYASPEKKVFRPKLFVPGQEAKLAAWLAGNAENNVYYHLNLNVTQELYGGHALTLKPEDVLLLDEGRSVRWRKSPRSP